MGKKGKHLMRETILRKLAKEFELRFKRSVRMRNSEAKASALVT